MTIQNYFESRTSMRSVTYLLSPEGGRFDAFGLPLRNAGVGMEAIHAVRTMGDDSVVVHVEVTGDPDRVRQPPDAWADRLRGYQVAVGDDGTLVHLHLQLSGLLEEVVRVHREHAVVPQFPIDVVDPDAGTIRVVETGHVAELRGVIEELREVANVTIEEVGTYDPTSNRLFTGLTERQQQVLCTAVEQGYYDVPREVTYEDIASELDCSASTVGQHLRRIEATVLAQIAPCKREPAVRESAIR